MVMGNEFNMIEFIAMQVGKDFTFFDKVVLFRVS
jgi:hypothetical protein